jgi:hypothetical protein
MTKSYAIRFVWGSRPQTPAEIAETILRTAEELGKLDPLYQSWWVLDGYIERDLVPLRRAKFRLKQIVENNVMRDDFGDPESDWGHSCEITTGVDGGPDGISLNISAGIPDVRRLGGNDIVFSTEYGVDPDPRVIAYPLFKSMMMTVVRVWDVAMARAFCLNAPEDPRTMDRFIGPAWITYLAPRLAAQITPPDGVLCEWTPEGGMVLIATEETFDPSHEDHVNAAWAMSDALELITKKDIV